MPPPSSLVSSSIALGSVTALPSAPPPDRLCASSVLRRSPSSPFSRPWPPPLAMGSTSVMARTNRVNALADSRSASRARRLSVTRPLHALHHGVHAGVRTHCLVLLVLRRRHLRIVDHSILAGLPVLSNTWFFSRWDRHQSSPNAVVPSLRPLLVFHRLSQCLTSLHALVVARLSFRVRTLSR